MWIKAAMELFGMGQENTIRNQQNQNYQNQQLANVLFANKRDNEEAIVLLGIFVVIGIVMYLVIKGN